MINNRLLSKLSILTSSKEKIFEGPQCTKAYMRTPIKFLTLLEAKRRRFRKKSIIKFLSKSLLSIATKLALLFIRIYQWVLSPVIQLFFGPSVSCRFFPSCSEYGRQALKQHGFLKGMILTVKRFFSCHPFHSGGYNPVPQTFHPLDIFRKWWLLSSSSVKNFIMVLICTFARCCPPKIFSLPNNKILGFERRLLTKKLSEETPFKEI